MASSKSLVVPKELVYELFFVLKQMDYEKKEICKDDPISLLVCSVDKISGSSFYQGVIPLQSPIKGCKKMSVYSSVIPNTAYVLNGVPFVFEEQAGGGAIVITITGNYTGNSLALYLQAQMTALSPGGHAYTVTYSTDSGKMTYLENTALLAFRIVGTTAQFPYYKLGFNPVVTVYAVTITTPNIVDLSPPKYVLVVIEGTQKRGQAQVSGTNTMIGDFLLPLGGNSWDLGNYYQKSMYDSWIHISKFECINYIKYSMLDPETKQLMQLQSNWVIQFRVE